MKQLCYISVDGVWATLHWRPGIGRWELYLDGGRMMRLYRPEEIARTMPVPRVSPNKSPNASGLGRVSFH